MDGHVYGGQLKYHCAHSTPRRRQNAHPQPHLQLPLRQPTHTHAHTHVYTHTHTHTHSFTLVSRHPSGSNHPHLQPHLSRGGSKINQCPSGLRPLLLLLHSLGLVHVLVDEMEGYPAFHELHEGEASCREQSTAHSTQRLHVVRERER